MPTGTTTGDEEDGQSQTLIWSDTGFDSLVAYYCSYDRNGNGSAL